MVVLAVWVVSVLSGTVASGALGIVYCSLAMKYMTYRSRLRRSGDVLSCDRCADGVSRSALDRERHAFEVHGLDGKTRCPWCWGPLPDPEGRVVGNVGHLSRCFDLLVSEEAAAARPGCDRTELRCCGLVLGVRDFDAHVRSVHGFTADSDCVWCMAHGTTRRHRTECLAGRLAPDDGPAPPVVDAGWDSAYEEALTTDPCRVCRVFDASERRRLMEDGRTRSADVAGLYESVGETAFLREEWFRGSSAAAEDPYGEGAAVRFDDRCGLGSDAPFFVRRFEELGAEAVSWFHFFVRADAFAGFLEAFAPLFESGSVGLLPFWCLCDGGGRVHRHGIAVARTAAVFERAYREVRFDDGADRRRDEKCKSFSRILTAHHLVNCVCYVGGLRSRCAGDAAPRHDDLPRPGGAGCHFHLNRPVSPHARMYLSMCVRGGLEGYLRGRHGNRDVYAMPSLFYDAGRRTFCVRVRDLLDREPRGCAIPLAPDLEEDPVVGGGPGGVGLLLWSLDDDRVRLRRVGGFRPAHRLPLLRRASGLAFELAPRQRRMARHVLETRRTELAASDEDRRLLRDRVAGLEAEAAARDVDVRTLRDRVAVLEEDKRRRTMAGSDELRARVAELEAELRDLRKDSVHSDVVSALRLGHSEFVSALRLEHASSVERIRAEHRAELREAEARVRALLEERFSTVVRLLEEAVDGHVAEKRDLAGRNRALTAEAGDLRTQVGGLFEGLVSLLRTWFGDGGPVKRRRVEDEM